MNTSATLTPPASASTADATHVAPVSPAPAGVAAAAAKAPAVAAQPQINLADRLVQLRAEQIEIEVKLAKEESERQAADAKARKAQIAGIPAMLGVENLTEVIRLLATVAGIEVRIFGAGAPAKAKSHHKAVVTQTRVLTPKSHKAHSKSNHGKGFRLDEARDAQLMALLRQRQTEIDATGASTIVMSSLKSRFGLAAQSLYNRIDRIKAENRTAKRARSRAK